MNDRASVFPTVVTLIVLAVTYRITDPANNVNYAPASAPQTRMHRAHISRSR